MHPKSRWEMLDCKNMQVKTWFAREKRSTEAFTRGRTVWRYEIPEKK